MSTETKTKHFAEPWLVTNDGEFISIRSTGTDRADWQSYVAKVNESETFDQDHVNAARIVACVNACAGVEDPDAAIKMARSVIKEIYNQGLEHLVPNTKKALRLLGYDL